MSDQKKEKPKKQYLKVASIIIAIIIIIVIFLVSVYKVWGVVMAMDRCLPRDFDFCNDDGECIGDLVCVTENASKNIKNECSCVNFRIGMTKKYTNKTGFCAEIFSVNPYTNIRTNITIASPAKITEINDQPPKLIVNSSVGSQEGNKTFIEMGTAMPIREENKKKQIKDLVSMIVAFLLLAMCAVLAFFNIRLERRCEGYKKIIEQNHRGKVRSRGHL